MIDRRSLRLRLTIAYATCAFLVLWVAFLVAAAGVFDVVIRPESLAFESSVRFVEGEIDRAPAGEPLEATQRRVMAAAASRGIGTVAIPQMVFRNHGSPPTGYIDIGSFFRLAPDYIPVRGGAIAVVPAAREKKRTAAAFEILVLVVTVLAAWGAWRLARFGTDATLRPLLLVTDELERFASGDFTPRHVHLAEMTEFGRLTAAYNAAAERVTQAFFERRSVEERIRHFVADAGHGLRTPLTVLSGYVDVLRREDGVDARMRRDAFGSVATEIVKMRTLVEGLVKLARLDDGLAREREIVAVTPLVREVVRGFSVTAPGPIALDEAADVRAFGEPADVLDVVENLVANAVKYGAGTPVAVAITTEGDWGVVRVRDGGPGIAETDRARIFERFYRGERRPNVAGSGLGLAIAAKAAERLRGRLTLEEARAGRTTFALFFPAS